MGLFSSKTKYYVASQIYNLAGDLSDRPNYMKSLAVQSAIIGDNIAGRIQEGIFQGPGFNLRAFQKWANLNYQQGLPTADITVDEVATLAPIKNQIPVPSGSPAGSSIIVINAVLSEADAEYWIERYIINNRPDLKSKSWVYEQDDLTNEITVTFSDNTPDLVFTPTNWYPNAQYVIARYVVSSPGTHSEQVNHGVRGPFKTVGGVGIAGFAETAREPRPERTFSLVRKETVRTEYRDNTPATQTVSETSVNATHIPEVVWYLKDTNKGFYAGTTIPHIYRERKIVTYNKVKRIIFTRNIVKYTDRVVTTTVEQDVLEDSITYTYNTQNRQGNSLSDSKVFIYRIGTGNTTLDNLKRRVATQREFYPVMPLRLDNKFINESPYEDTIYPDIAKAYKKAFGSKIDTILDELEDNDSLDDLDFAFLVFGITINERDKIGKLYMYEFLKGLIPYQRTSKSGYGGYQNTLIEQAKRTNEYKSYLDNMLGRLGADTSPNPANLVPSYPPPQRTSFILDSNIPDLNHYKITISWSYIHETLGVGVGKTGAKKGDIWFETGATLRGTADPLRDIRENDSLISRYLRNGPDVHHHKQIFLYHQITDLTYRKLEIVGLEHSNYVYKNKSVVTYAYDAIKDNDEESPFFIPLHYPTVKKLTVKDQNQLAYCSRLLLLNCYVKKKVKWYQRGIFKIIFAIAMIAISIITLGPASFGALPGLLGTNVAVGTALGLAGTAAIIAGAVANMVAAMILTTIVQKASIKLLGDKWGHIIGAIASFFALQVGVNFAMTGSFTMNWGNMFSPNNILKLTSSVAKGYGAFIQGRMQDVMEDYQSASKEYKDQLQMIEDRMSELLGQAAWIDPMLLTEMAQADDSSLRESSGSFLNRTLLTGSDIAEMSCAMIDEFPTLSLALPEAIV